MNINKIHKTFVSSRVVFFACVFVFLVFRLQGDWSEVNLWVCTMLQISIALFLLPLNNFFSMIRRRTLLPAIFYLILTGWNPIFNYDLNGSIATLLIMLNYLFLFNAYQKSDSQLNAFNISLILVLCSFFQPQLLLFLPIFWIGFYWFRSFNLRVFLASLTGIVAVYWIIFAWSIYWDDWRIFLVTLPKPGKIFFVSELHLSDFELISFGVILLVLIFAGLNLFVLSISEKVKTISFLKYMYVSSFIFLFLAFVQSEYRSYWESVSYIPVSLILAHYFTLTNKLYAKILMLLFIFLLLALGGIQFLILNS
ncbi:MAG: hypothetical protein LBR97_08725 [Dysgonamonadaceae bacterium]|jgi:hypothetical protein|nr:hypothetical protein [Dysgonamonadaceae bacterium]